VRRQIEPGGQAMGGKKRGQKGTGGPFAVGAHYLDGQMGQGGQGQMGQGRAHAVEAKIHVEQTKTVEIGRKSGKVSKIRRQGGPSGAAGDRGDRPVPGAIPLRWSNKTGPSYDRYKDLVWPATWPAQPARASV